MTHLPREITTAINTFTQYYFGKFNNGRQLHWKLSLGSAELKSKLNSSTRYEFTVSTYQMCLLYLFNTHSELTY